jgi:putative DNA primase/helicase
MSLNFEDVRPHAQGQWLSILGHVSPSLAEAIEKHPKHVPCPVHGGKDGFRLYRNCDETGGGICNTCGAYSDGFAMASWVNGWTLPDTLQAVADYLGISTTSKTLKPIVKRSPVIPDPIKEANTVRRKRDALNAVWKDLRPLSDEQAKPAINYLINRGLGECLKSLPGDVFFHPALSYWEDGQDYGQHPAMVALVRDKNGDFITLHRTYLNQDGFKADLPTTKKLMSPIKQGASKGGAIRLYEPSDELILAEGIETALALHVSLNKPVWACVSAGGLESVQLPATVKQVIIGSDNDASGAGQMAANVLAARLMGEDKTREVKIITPEHVGTDWLDVLNNEEHAA